MEAFQEQERLVNKYRELINKMEKPIKFIDEKILFDELDKEEGSSKSNS